MRNAKKTINISPELHRDLAVIAGGRGMTVGKLAEVILSAYILQSTNPKLKLPERNGKRKKT